MPTVDMSDAETNLWRLVESVERGAETEIVIARNGKPVARLVPAAAKPDVSKRLGLLAGKHPVVTLEDFNASDDTILQLFYGNEGAERFRDKT